MENLAISVDPSSGRSIKTCSITEDNVRCPLITSHAENEGQNESELRIDKVDQVTLVIIIERHNPVLEPRFRIRLLYHVDGSVGLSLEVVPYLSIPQLQL